MSSSSSEVSQASTKVSRDTNGQLKSKATAIKNVALSATAQDIILFLIAFRVLNALVVQTFFQPDEYFQSLEPAWEFAFGPGSGAWITWEWKTHLRSAIYPALFASLYRALDLIAKTLSLSKNAHAELLLAGPKILQALLAASGDYYTWKLAERVYGKGSATAGAALALTVASPWQWFCSTRSLSNCLETTLTIVALYNWPWHWSLAVEDEKGCQVDGQGLRIRDAEGPADEVVDELTRLRRALLLAALATVLRPTNILIWVTLVCMTFFRSSTNYWPIRLPWTEQSALVHFSAWSLVPNSSECLTMLRESVLCGGAVLSVSALVDRLFYGAWTFPPFNFLYFNVVQSLAVFYGSNDWHYYLSQGYPLLLTTSLPFALMGIYQNLSSSRSIAHFSKTSMYSLQALTIIAILVPATLSLISHKEVRFIYPLLPPLNTLAARPLHDFFAPSLLQHHTHPKLTPPCRLSKRILLAILLSVNAFVALYTTTAHNSGLISVTTYLRHEFSDYYQPLYPNQNMTVAFLMPCHSTPWRSHLQFPPTANQTGIAAWALTCEPPIHLTLAQKAAYKDEADEFYEHPSLWLRRNMVRGPPRSPAEKARIANLSLSNEPRTTYAHSWKREWPDYLVFFEQLEKSALRGSGYRECLGGRMFNSRWHDDWRRTGDVVVYCLDKNRQMTELEVRRREEKDLRFSEKDSVSGYLSGIKGLTKESAEKIHVAGRTLGGGLGPWGVGELSHHQQQNKALPDHSRRKPFWKMGGPEEKKWWQNIPGLARKKEQSWWRRVFGFDQTGRAAAAAWW